MSDRKPGGKTSEVRPLRSSSKRTKRGIGLAVVCLITGLASAGVYRMRQTAAPANLPLAPARKGDFSVIVRSRRDLKARRAVQHPAPLNPTPPPTHPPPPPPPPTTSA